MSLPLAFGTTLETIPAPPRYLAAPADRAAQWAESLGPRRGLRVGLAWAGGVHPDQPETWWVDALRSVPRAAFAPLNVAGVEFHSLQ
jgi:hypothetical protein